MIIHFQKKELNLKLSEDSDKKKIVEASDYQQISRLFNAGYRFIPSQFESVNEEEKMNR